MAQIEKYPPMYPVRQHFHLPRMEDVTAAVEEQFATFPFPEGLGPGQSVAVCVGSRGIHDLPHIVAAVVRCFKALGLRPRIIPAMGSHGGATAEGQAGILRDLGITESSVGAPVVSSMEVVSLGTADSGMELFCARDGLEADWVVPINRVKPHTAFRGQVESGLCKMLAVGLGKQKGASAIHRYGLARAIVPAVRTIMERARVLCGLALLESPSGGIFRMRLVPPERFERVDEEFLQEAWRIFPRLPLEDLDVLIVDEMGKEISGAGMDPNVIGFWRREGGPRQPDYRILIVLDLSPQSHGNATGIGLADLTTRRVMDQVDLRATYANALTSGVLRSARLPIAMEDDRSALETALAHAPDPRRVRMARIVNTLRLEAFWVTEALLPDLRGRKNVDIGNEPLSLRFDGSGRLQPFPSDLLEPVGRGEGAGNSPAS